MTRHFVCFQTTRSKITQIIKISKITFKFNFYASTIKFSHIFRYFWYLVMCLIFSIFWVINSRREELQAKLKTLNRESKNDKNAPRGKQFVILDWFPGKGSFLLFCAINILFMAINKWNPFSSFLHWKHLERIKLNEWNM